MNYRHAYHAGNFADALKHIVLLCLLEHLKKKASPFAVLDTHAGMGMYALGDEKAQKTGEYRDGIGRLLAGKPVSRIDSAVDHYLDIVRGLNPGALVRYPGSPWIAARLLRDQDRLIACELHPEDAAILKALFPREKNIHVHMRDGYQAMRAFLPFAEKRGLVFIDPPYEKPGEWRAIVDALEDGLTRFRQGIYAIWYPLKDASAAQRFYASLASLQQEILMVEMTVKPPSDGGLYGTGMAILNPPWQLDEQLRNLLPGLSRALSQGMEDWRVEMLT